MELPKFEGLEFFSRIYPIACPIRLVGFAAEKNRQIVKGFFQNSLSTISFDVLCFNLKAFNKLFIKSE